MANAVAMRRGLDYLKEHIEEWDQNHWTKCYAAMVMKAHNPNYDNSTYPSEVEVDARELLGIGWDETQKFFSFARSLDYLEELVKSYEERELVESSH